MTSFYIPVRNLISFILLAGARQHGFLPKDCLTDLTGPKPPPRRKSVTSSSSDDADDSDDTDDDDDDNDDDEIAPPLPPRRSESLLKSTLYNNGTQDQDQIPTVLTANLQEYMALQGKFC